MNEIDDNLPIAKFMGYPYYKEKCYIFEGGPITGEDRYLGTVFSEKDDFYFFGDKQMIRNANNILINPNYRYSWDWIMTVVEKIEKLGFDIHIDPKRRCVIFNGNKNLLIDTSYGKTKIDSVWFAVMKFIEWYYK